MDKNYKRLTDYLVGLGVDHVNHTTKTYLGHLVAVYRLMEANDCTEEVCQAGMFHSIYGTQRFQGFKLPLEKRGEVRELIGAGRAPGLSQLRHVSPLVRRVRRQAGWAVSHNGPHHR